MIQILSLFVPVMGADLICTTWNHSHAKHDLGLKFSLHDRIIKQLLIADFTIWINNSINILAGNKK